ncbi:MAG: hypothetical protein LUI14_12600 [Lachnospiraceae bacterium]|nr:hypothetical protein [Lachnospiraceae bacterium]
MAIMTYGCSQQGGREYNEDCFGIGKQLDRCCVVVADGLGATAADISRRGRP